MFSMSKEKESLQRKLLHRNFHIPNRLYNWFYHLIMVDIKLKKHNPVVHRIDDPRKEKEGAIVLWTHLSRLDHSYIQAVMYPRPFNMVAGYCEFFRSHLQWAFKRMSILPKKNFCVDVFGVKAILSIIKKKGVVSMSPEGLATVTGMNENFIEGVGKLIKHCKVPVYFARFDGQALVAPVFSHYYREGGRSEVTVYKMFSKEDIMNLSPEEIENKLREEFGHNDYEYQEKNHFKWDTKGQGCDGMHDICYKCPSCGEEFHMHGEGDTIKCDACGFEAKCNEYLELVPNKEVKEMPKYPSDWVLMERKDIIKQIRENPDFSFSFKTTIGIQPPDHYVKSKDHAAEVVGEGIFTFDHQGLHYDGTKLGEHYHFDLSYEVYYRLIFEVNTHMFALYIDDEYVEFLPEEPVAFKADLICSEMNRLHFKTWPPLERDKYLYE